MKKSKREQSIVTTLTTYGFDMRLSAGFDGYEIVPKHYWAMVSREEFLRNGAIAVSKAITKLKKLIDRDVDGAINTLNRMEANEKRDKV